MYSSVRYSSDIYLNKAIARSNYSYNHNTNENDDAYEVLLKEIDVFKNGQKYPAYGNYPERVDKCYPSPFSFSEQIEAIYHNLKENL